MKGPMVGRRQGRWAAAMALGLVAVTSLQGAGEALEFRDLVPSARASALGGAVVALPGLDGAAMNPAALAYLREGALQGSHLALVQDLSVEQLLLGWPTGFGSVGADLRLLQAPDLAGMDAAGNMTGANVPSREASYGLAWAGEWHGLGLGLAANMVAMDLGGSHASGTSLDGGLQWALPAGCSLGVSLRNGGWLSALDSVEDPLGAETAVGASWAHAWSDSSLSLSAQGLRQGLGAWQATVAAEVGLGGSAFLRGSFTPVQPQGQAAPFSVGVGARFDALELDGAWVPYGDLGATFRVSATLLPGRWMQGADEAMKPELAVNKDGVYRLFWKEQPGAQGYQVYRRSRSDAPWVKLMPGSVSGTALLLKGLRPGKHQTFSVRPIQRDGLEGPGGEVSLP
jgi:hypothetical protein